jgi:hypothetical protein
MSSDCQRMAKAHERMWEDFVGVKNIGNPSAIQFRRSLQHRSSWRCWIRVAARNILLKGVKTRSSLAPR